MMSKSFEIDGSQNISWIGMIGEVCADQTAPSQIVKLQKRAPVTIRNLKHDPCHVCRDLLVFVQAKPNSQ